MQCVLQGYAGMVPTNFNEYQPDGSISLIPSTIADGYIEFETTHLSKYAIVSYQEEIIRTPNTGDDIQAGLLWLILISGSTGMIVMGIKRKKKEGPS